MIDPVRQAHAVGIFLPSQLAQLAREFFFL
jgi:hypothetical protein